MEEGYQLLQFWQIIQYCVVRCVSLLVECEAVGTTNAEVLVQLVDASGAEDRSVTGQSTGSLGQGSCWLR